MQEKHLEAGMHGQNRSKRMYARCCIMHGMDGIGEICVQKGTSSGSVLRLKTSGDSAGSPVSPI